MNNCKNIFPKLAQMVAVVCVTAGVSLMAQSLPDGNLLVKDTARALKQYDTVQYVSRTTIQVGSGGVGRTSEKSFVIVSPDKIRIESRSSGLATLIVSDGVTTTAYGQGKYTRISGTLSSLSTALGLDAPDIGSTKSGTVGEETIEIDGHSYDCWVVEATLDGATMSIPQMGSPRTSMTGTMKIWIDKKSRIDVQSSAAMSVTAAGRPAVNMTVRDVKSQLRINQPIDDAVFSYMPPADATEVPAGDYLFSMLAPLRGRPLTGKSAPAFELPGLGGNSYNLAGIAGHPVVLDFWATWCIPCRASIPVLNDFYAKHKKDGIIVIGVNMGETPEEVRKFTDHLGIRYPLAFGAGTNIGDSFQVTVFPTLVLIDPEGKIQSYEIGFNTTDSLRQTLTQFSAGFAK